jgi:uncharacterized membrane protein
MANSFIEQSMPVFTLLAAVCTGLMGGVFFAFSNLVMKSLASLPAALGITAMQSINIVAINPLFMGVLFGTASTCAVLAIYSLPQLQRPGFHYLLLGSMLYLVGAILVTIFFNVPLNNALAQVDPASAEGVRIWNRYLTTWTSWNHVRTVASILASAAFSLAIYRIRN